MRFLSIFSLYFKGYVWFFESTKKKFAKKNNFLIFGFNMKKAKENKI